MGLVNNLNELLLHYENLIEYEDRFSTNEIKNNYDLIKTHIETLKSRGETDPYVQALQICKEGLDRILATRQTPRP